MRPADLTLDQVPALLTVTELELAAKGYSEREVRAATRYMVNRAEGVAFKAQPAHRDGVFLTTLAESTESVERWLQGNRQAAREHDMGSGVERALAEGRTERGYERMGVDGGGAARRWREAAQAGVDAYEAFWSESHAE